MHIIPAVALLFLFLQPCLSSKKTYIVAMNRLKPSVFPTHHEWYAAQLQSISPSLSSLAATDEDSILYPYSTAYIGFAASLEHEAAEALRQSKDVLSVLEDTVYELHTTRTPKFLGLDKLITSGLWAGNGSRDLYRLTNDVIIGVLDTGVWPESKSFDDTGMPVVPKKWAGGCVSGPGFNPKKHCNKKLIGARFFHKGYQSAMAANGEKSNKTFSPLDTDGHGTHTASTAAGAVVRDASLFGYASGKASGMVPGIRIASYKVCWDDGCFSSDILAAIDRAIHDGVDVLSLSLGGFSINYYNDVIAKAAFSAMEKGIFVSCSAGNGGPGKYTLSNVSPWIMTVGAGTIDRDFPAYVTLGSGVNFTGASLYRGKGMGKTQVPLVYGAGKDRISSKLCFPGSLDPNLVTGKVVLCDRGVNPRVEKGSVVQKAGGVGMILANTEVEAEELLADSHYLPAASVGRKAGDKIRKYVFTQAKNKSPATVVISFGGTVVGVKPAPLVASFSSRGPNHITPQILKPDVIGPGVNILAAWPSKVGLSGLPDDTRSSPFNILSGTSMSCPHVSGLAALIKAANPKWSPAAIKSALMTTAYVRDNTNLFIRGVDSKVSTSWDMGAGYVDPVKALSPGLVYDISQSQYRKFLCSLNYTDDNVNHIINSASKYYNCTKKLKDPGQLNYPSFSIVFRPKSKHVLYTRILTNVGEAKSTYQVSIEAPASVNIIVSPEKLSFKKVGQRLKYTARFVSKKGVNLPEDNAAFGSISWINAQKQVRSPIAFTWDKTTL